MKFTYSFRRSFVFGACLLSLLLPRAHANLISGYESQLETWLGQGNLNFTQIFEKGTGDNYTNFHAAVDGQGATLTLMSVSGAGFSGQIIGGYNPQSWNSSDSYNFTPSDAARTAFIYNLTSSTIQRQNLNGQGYGGSGQYQAHNYQYHGPSFGGGADLFVQSSLNSGYAFNYSYGGTSFDGDIVDGTLNGEYTAFSVTALEIYTFTQGSNSIPDGTSTNVLIVFSLVGLVALRRRFARV